MFLEIDGLSKSYNNKVVLDRVSFKVQRGELVSVIGPSGAGKTTLLKLIASMEEPDKGGLSFSTSPSKENPVILVFQDYVLFPHLTVFENIAFGLRSRKMAKKVIDEKVHSILHYFKISDKAHVYPAYLSGGQKQRVAIARGIVINPSVLLLDEPFANLDKNLKQETAGFIRETQKKFGITTITVTHDLNEAFTMSDKLGILLDGKLEQFGSPGDLYFKPASYEVARFLGPVNIIPGNLFDLLGIDEPSCDECIYARAEGFQIEKDAIGPGIVKSVSFSGIMILYKVEVKGTLFEVYSLTNHLTEGEKVTLKVINYFKR